LSTEPTPELSVVIPLLNEHESLAELASRIDAAIGARPYEILFVDDGSTDGSWDVIASLAAADSRIKGIRFRRNYGKSLALQKGFERARGTYIATMDADLQDDPNELPAMFAMLDSGYDLVSGWKQVRHDPISKTIPSKFFNGVTSRMSGIDLHDFNCGLKVYKRDVIQSIYLYGEMHRYIPLLAKWQGFSKIGEKVVTHHARKYGKTKFGLSRFMNGFLDLITLMFIHTYMSKPMHFFGTLGFVSLSTGGAIVTYLAFMRVFYDVYLSNRPLLLFGILLLVMGVQLFSIGFVGEMLNNSEKRGRKVNIREEVGA
jgi:glycosyltransferase involved in cell wall biosynthesis